MMAEKVQKYLFDNYQIKLKNFEKFDINRVRKGQTDVIDDFKFKQYLFNSTLDEVIINKNLTIYS